MKIPASFLFLCFLSATNSFAENIYKSVDENGKVTYSSTPPSDSKKVTKVDIAAPPSAEDIEAAKQVQQRNIKTAGSLDEARNERDTQIAKDNQLKQERQRQSEQQNRAQENNYNQGYGYPYYPRRRLNANRPTRPIARPEPGPRPPIARPIGRR
jgi:hypothetical protein